MRIGLIASPFISVPPPGYGGTELFVANLAEALMRMGEDVIVYTNGESNVKARTRWLFPRHEWPLAAEFSGVTKEVEHASWAVADASKDCDVIHVNSALAVPLGKLTSRPMVCTLHHPFDPYLYGLYCRHKEATYVSISAHQASLLPKVPARVVHHGIDVGRYRFQDTKKPYLCFLGRICPIKGPHNAIAIAKQAGMPLKIAGEVQPIFKQYFDTQIKPHIDGRNIEFLGEANFEMKLELLGNATALLFPIEWDEPFGLVMIESMACGTPVLAFAGGAVGEIVHDRISGRVCRNVDDAVNALRSEAFNPRSVRRWVETRFSSEVMAQRYQHIYSQLVDEGVFEPTFDTEGAAA
jgi:glycosyltransferase involved in cell wall biosynthesis